MKSRHTEQLSLKMQVSGDLIIIIARRNLLNLDVIHDAPYAVSDKALLHACRIHVPASEARYRQ